MHPQRKNTSLTKPGTLGSWNFFLQPIPIRYRYNVADANFDVVYRLHRVADTKVVKSSAATKSVPDGNKLADFTLIRLILPMFYWYLLMFTRCLPDGSRGIQPVLPTLKKLLKLMKISEKCKNMGWQHCICQGITRFLGIIGSHRWNQ